jgi:EamA domain-containing membrane protein RarD
VSKRPGGVGYGLAAYSLWGLFPLYWPLLKPASAGEILAHRCLWSLIVVLGVLAYYVDSAGFGRSSPTGAADRCSRSPRS